MAKTDLPSQELLLQLLKYDQDTGRLYWRARPVHMFESKTQSAKHNASIWNGRYADKEAFTAHSSEGYKRGTIDGVHFVAHRIIWKMQTGVNPDDIDHIDGVRDNNKWANLRNVTRSENLRNLSLSRRNTSGSIGVCPDSRGKVWRAYAWDGNKHVALGEYAKKDEAIAARQRWESNNFYHPNHGKINPRTTL